MIDSVPQTDWVFFSSKNGVKYFFEQKPNLNPFAKYACIGTATAQALLQYINKVEWTGSTTDLEAAGKEFVKLAGNETILFPTAKNTIRTVQKQFANPQQAIDLTVYETHTIAPQNIPPHDVIVFTSPSNVNGYFAQHKEHSNITHIAIGNSTATALEKHGVKNVLISKGFSDIDLLAVVFGR